MQTSCCAESMACAADPGCLAFEDCYGQCAGDLVCRSQCTFSPSGRTTSAAVPELAACAASKCESACAFACGAVGAAAVPDAAVACQTCMQANACGPALACAQSADCLGFTFCTHTCTTFDCAQRCGDTRDAGIAVYTPEYEVLGGTCYSPCGGGTDWSCVGHVSWPRAQYAMTTMTTLIGVGATEAPVAGADVRVSQYCGPSDAGSTLLAEGQTGDAGTVTFPVSLQGYGPGGYNGLDGCITMSAAGYWPTLWYWGFPLTEASVQWLTPSTPTTGLFVPALTAADATGLYAAAGTAMDPSRGIVGVTLFDCDRSPAPGVTVMISSDDPDIRVLYGNNFSATAGASDMTGSAFLVGVPTGTWSVTATPVATGKVASTQTVSVEASTFTEVLMFPTP